MQAELGKEKISGEAILESLNWRYATKNYDKTRKISAADWAVIEQALLLAPSSYGLQPYKFLVVSDPDVREKLRTAAWNQPQLTDASHLVVFAYKKTQTEADIARFIDRIAEVRGQARESLADYENLLNGSVKKAIDGGYIEVWNSRQAYIALGFLLETAAHLGIDATPMEGFDAAQFNQILGLTDYSAVAVAALGYRDAANDWLANLKKVRFPAEQLIEKI
ncbi:MAG: NAD(P)H-dependent oxidoreductase [Acidobacteria bacterium]|nr:NAD(P)H-dependent oxidoreductase [Acidobacteriota bacterium]